VLRLGFAGCRGGGTSDLLRGIEDVRWASRWWGSEAVGGATSATGGGWVVGGAGGAEAGCREEEDRRMRMGMGVVGVARLKKKQWSHDPLTCNPSHIRGPFQQ
jgi:hypothetical protein